VFIGAAIERLYDLKVGTTPVAEGAPHERPHKPLLLLAAFDLIDEGLATPDHIPWCQELRDRFTVRFLLVRKLNDQNNPDLPFRYLARDGFWQAFEADGKTPIHRQIRVADIGQDGASPSTDDGNGAAPVEGDPNEPDGLELERADDGDDLDFEQAVDRTASDHENSGWAFPLLAMALILAAVAAGVFVDGRRRGGRGGTS